jgi:hypothetical protein
MKLTAVEWFNQQLNLYGDMAFNKEITLGQYHVKKQELLEQAKAMEAEQIMQAYNDGKYAAIYVINNKSLEQYYNEIYGGAK